MPKHVLPSSKEQISGEAEQNSGEHAQGILLVIYDRLGQISATSGWGVQQHAALNDRDQSFHDVDWQGESNAPDILLPGIRGKKTSPEAYLNEVVSRQQELNELCRRSTAQTQMRQQKYDEKTLQAKLYAVGQYVWVFQNFIPPKGTKKLLKKRRGPFMITEVHQQGRFYRLSTGRAAHYKNLKPHVPSPEDWCVPQNMEGLEYLRVEPACELNGKGTREKNDGNEDVRMDDNEKIEVESDEGSFAEEDWNDSEQNEVPK